MQRNQKTLDILSIGEALIDFTPDGRPGVYIRNFGGAPANLALVAARMGAKVGFAGTVGRDAFGEFLIRKLQDEGVDAQGVCCTDEACTTLAFIHLSENGERSFQFVRKPGADMLLEIANISQVQQTGTRIVHFGSAQMMRPNALHTLEQMICTAKRLRQTVSFDPNYRAPQWYTEEEARSTILHFTTFADLLKVSDEEALWLTGASTVTQAARQLGQDGKLVVVTCGRNGAWYYRDNHEGFVRGFARKAIDTTGAGDAFWGCFLAVLSETVSDPLVDNMTEQVIVHAIQYANAAGAICVGEKGAAPASLQRTAIFALAEQR